MTELQDYNEFTEGPLVFSINGKRYEHELSISTGLWLNDATNDKESLENLSNFDVWKRVLGPVWDEMVADNVPMGSVARAGQAAVAEVQGGRVYAEAVWAVGLDPKAISEFLVKKNGNRAQKRSRSTGGATTTKRPASTKATTSRRR